MVRLGMIAVLVPVVLSCNQMPRTVVKVYVEGEKDRVSPQMVTKDSTYEVALDSANTAVFVCAGNLEPGYAQLRCGRVTLPVYLEPDKSFEVDLTWEGRRLIPRFTGEGAKKNEYLNREELRNYFPDFKSDEEAFMVSLDRQVARLYAIVDSMGFDHAFCQLEKKRIHYSVYRILGQYPSYHSYYTGQRDFKPTGQFYAKLKSAVKEEEALIGLPEYQDALRGMVDVMASRDSEARDGLQRVKDRLAYVDRQITSPVIAEDLVHHLVMSYVRRAGGVEQLDGILPVYAAKVADPAKKAELDGLCAQWAKIAQGQPAPDFKYSDIQGREVSLKELSGNYVFIDVWATWCGPCRRELPHLKELERKFEKKRICFVSISCDRDKAAWENMVKADKLGGIQLHNGGDREFMDAFMIRAIPRFILLDREGKIVASNMTRPSNPKTTEILNALEGI